jgi:cytochrome c-type biogenesis protein CcmE
MHPVRKQRLILVIAGVIASSIAVGLIVYAMRENINLFYPPSKIAAGEVPHNRTIRGGGCVKPGSIVRSKESLDINFILTDGNADVPVRFSGILPDLFAEGEAAVVNGKIDDKGVFNAEQVLAKHDETYTPPEVASMNKQSGQEKDGEHKNDQAVCKGMNYGS